jgi:phosphoglucomutase
MTNVLANLRNNPPHAIAGIDVASVRDLLNSKITDLKTGEVAPVIHLPKQDMLTFYLADNSWISLRPSGTEPKLKIYYSVKAADFESAKAEGEAIKAEVTALLGF